MKSQLLAIVVIAVPMTFAAAPPCFAQQPAGWTWKDASGNSRTRDELDQILLRHKQWVESGGRLGGRADFTKAVLTKAELSGANLSIAHFEDADLTSGTASRSSGPVAIVLATVAVFASSLA